MKIDVLLGLQWGDEGKGKVVDLITPRYDIIARFQGGPNAGHSLEFNRIKHVLHSIPSGIFHPDKVNVIGNGVVIDPTAFKEEIGQLLALGVDPLKNLQISSKAHLILPSHRLLDFAQETAKGKSKIGSTLRGIGPAYTDKTGRNGLRVGDILRPDFLGKYQKLKEQHLLLSRCYGYDYSAELAEREPAWLEAVDLLRRFPIIESEYELNRYLAEERSILAEGAQGTLLDVDFGSYPFVTSSHTVAAGACSGLGVPPSSIGNVIGIVKAYCTRVGSGPFPTELLDEQGEKLRENGNEFGSTTGRPRRCGWLDLVALKYAVMLNGVTEIVLTKADVLSGFDEIKVCTAYLSDGQSRQQVPFDNEAEITPLYQSFKGWEEDITGIREYGKLPGELRDYIDFIEQETQVKISIVSVGPDRDASIQK